MRQFAFLLFAVAALSGCSGARLAYNNADTAVRWMADDYFALEGAQQDDFRARLARFHAWHRSEELPRYSALMASAAGKLAHGLTQPELLWAWDSVIARYRNMVAQAAPDLAAVLVTLSPAQLQHLEQKFAESNAEYASKHLSGSVAEQRARRDKRNLELMREWFGDLSVEQEAQLQAASARLPLPYALRLQNRQRRQGEFLTLLKTYRSAEELEPALRRWLSDWEGGVSPEYRRVADLHRDRYMQMLLQLDGSLALGQRAHAVARLTDYARIFAALSGQSKLARLGPE
ncbi:MAG: hypothetical protein JJE42_10700 [Burkholderiales bacterium]|nr:hypothetical protein [Burkholderiales bacterium]